LVTEDALKITGCDVSFVCLVHDLEEVIHLGLGALLRRLVDKLAELFYLQLT